MPLTAHADTQAETVLKKMLALYQNAKTYHGTITMQQGGAAKDGKPYSLTQIQEVSYKSPNMIRVQIKLSGTGAAANVSGQSRLTTADGKSSYQYIPSQKMYMKGPVQPVLPKPFPATLKLDMTTAKMLPGSSLDGHSVYMVQAQGVLPPNVPADKLAQAKAALTFDFAIDKSTYYLLQFTPGKQKPIVLSNQTVNGSIADSAFVFTPPPGSKLYTPPPQGSMPPGGLIPGGSGAPPKQ
jgi:outer membrane lipoprotein-sorting protein